MKRNRKLHLHRETLRHLGQHQLRAANGGTYITSIQVPCDYETTACQLTPDCGTYNCPPSQGQGQTCVTFIQSCLPQCI